MNTLQILMRLLNDKPPPSIPGNSTTEAHYVGPTLNDIERLPPLGSPAPRIPPHPRLQQAVIQSAVARDKAIFSGRGSTPSTEAYDQFIASIDEADDAGVGEGKGKDKGKGREKRKGKAQEEPRRLTIAIQINSDDDDDDVVADQNTGEKRKANNILDERGAKLPCSSSSSTTENTTDKSWGNNTTWGNWGPGSPSPPPLTSTLGDDAPLVVIHAHAPSAEDHSHSTLIPPSLPSSTVGPASMPAASAAPSSSISLTSSVLTPPVSAAPLSSIPSSLPPTGVTITPAVGPSNISTISVLHAPAPFPYPFFEESAQAEEMFYVILVGPRPGVYHGYSASRRHNLGIYPDYTTFTEAEATSIFTLAYMRGLCRVEHFS